MSETIIVDRLEDMSPNGSLRLFIQEDGDILICVNEPGKYGEESRNASAEFCSCGSGGGGSPKTHAALRALALAMAEDNADSLCAARANEFPGTELLRLREMQATQAQFAGQFNHQ